MKHFGIFDTVEDAQDALNAGRLENDYVALVDGELDYNSMEPQEDEPEVYITDTDGNTYYPREIMPGEEYYFIFEMDPEAQIQLFDCGEPVTSDTGSIRYIYRCEDDGTEQTIMTGMAPIDFSTPFGYVVGYNEPTAYVAITYSRTNSYVDGDIVTLYCEGGGSSSS